MTIYSIKRLSLYLLYGATIHLFALLVFFLFRLSLFLSVHYTFPVEIAHDFGLQATAFVRGLWFDNVIASYLSLLPLVILSIAAVCHYTSRWMFRLLTVYYATFYSLCCIIQAANIPYFQYFFKNINSSIYNWFGYGATTLSMVTGEKSYYFPIFLGLLSMVVVCVGISYWSRFIYQLSLQVFHTPSPATRIGMTFICLVVLGGCIIGIRGRISTFPIRVSQAYYCEDPFLNQLGINPVYYLLNSTLDDRRKENRRLQLMPKEQAITFAQQALNRTGIEHISPLARTVTTSGKPHYKHVVILFMESMSSHLMSYGGSTKQLTPFLDSLFTQSVSFDQFYSAGIHTNQGVYASLYSFPAILKRNAMKGSVVPIYTGLPTVLKEQGYQTLLFMTHESQYDNMNAFLRTNGFDEIYSQENYPADKVVNTYGVQDDFLYQYALPILNQRAADGQPFFSVLLSISNHPPYIVPSYFHPHSTQVEDQIVEYADWSIRQFMTQAAKQPWFKETIFVFLGDHGKMVGSPECEIPASYNHIPLMIYQQGITPQRISKIGGQIDLAPTLLGWLNMSYTQNNFGINLLHETRPCIYFSADNLIGVRDSSHLYIYSPESQQEFRYHQTPQGLRTAPADTLYQSLKTYCFSMMQSAETLVSRQQTIDHIHE